MRAMIGPLDSLLAGRPLGGLLVNCHAHIHTNWGLPRDDASPEAMLRTNDATGTDVSCISSSHAIASDVPGGNDQVIDAVRRRPSRFVGAAAVNPNYPREIEAELARAFAEPGVGMVKLHPEGHAQAIDGPGFEPVWGVLARRRIPALIHTWGEGRGLDHPLLVERVARRYPTVPLILAHAGGTPDGLRVSAEIARRAPNIFLDTGTSVSLRNGIEFLVEQAGAERVLFGTDGAYLADPPQVAKVAGARISDGDKERIFGLNMKAILLGTGLPLPALEGRTSPPVPLSTDVERGNVGDGCCWDDVP